MNSAAPSSALLPALAIMGPTASGKSALAMALAQALPVEILSVDSAQVYRGMDIGTAKPGSAERVAVPHHLIDILEPTEAYSAARFAREARTLIAEIRARGRTPLLVGGTMLYFKALREGLSDLPKADESLRTQIDAEAAKRGWPAMHAELAQVDPATAARLQRNDSQRIQRALEIYRSTGRPMSALLGTRAPDEMPVPMIEAALIPSERRVLHERIEARFDAMLAAGLVNELHELRSRHGALRPDLPSMRSVGYRQAWDHLEGAYDAATLRDRGIYATRQLAKRQLTWLRALPRLTVYDCCAADFVANARDGLLRRLEQGVSP
jgi:tRNA dimethylallyltransferase